MLLFGTQYLGVCNNVGWDFPAKKHTCLSGKKVFLNVISSVFNTVKA